MTIEFLAQSDYIKLINGGYYLTRKGQQAYGTKPLSEFKKGPVPDALTLEQLVSELTKWGIDVTIISE